MSLCGHLSRSTGTIEVLGEDRRAACPRRMSSGKRLRERPRRIWNFRHWLDADGRRPRPACWYAVPHHSRFLTGQNWIHGGPVSAGSSVSVNFATAGLGLAAGQQVVLWSGILDYGCFSPRKRIPNGDCPNS